MKKKVEANRLKCNHNLNTITVFSVIEGNMTHLASIDKRTNRIYSTLSGYRLIATDDFYDSHLPMMFDEEDEHEDGPAYRKFDVAVQFSAHELNRVISMCSRELVW